MVLVEDRIRSLLEDGMSRISVIMSSFFQINDEIQGRLSKWLHVGLVIGTIQSADMFIFVVWDS